MKLTLTSTIVVFTIFLTTWGHANAAGPNDPGEFYRYIQALETQFRAKSKSMLPFKEKFNVLGDLRETPQNFQDDLVANYKAAWKKHPTDSFSFDDEIYAASVLINTIDDHFKAYGESAGDHYVGKLSVIKAFDPVSFLAYLMHEATQSMTLAEKIEKYFGMISRLKYKVLEPGSSSKDTTESKGLEPESTSGDNNNKLDCQLCQVFRRKAETPHKLWAALDCGHAFGEECIDKLIINWQGKAECPLCRIAKKN